jgi:hypothetical protein
MKRIDIAMMSSNPKPSMATPHRSDLALAFN